jgi:DNA-binding transcriptional LysR family regulator
LQIKRLEEITGAPLFYRDHRKLTLTDAGTMLARYARNILSLNDEVFHILAGDRASGPVCIGMVEEFARALLGSALRYFSRLNPDAKVTIKVCGSQELRDLIGANRLDIALCLSAPTDDNVVVTRSAHWFGDEALIKRDILPLALLEKPCLFREQALAALDQAGIPYSISVETASVSALQAAVEGGLGVTSRTAGFLAAQRLELHLTSLPPLPQIGYTLLQSSKLSRSAETLGRILTTSLRDL